MDDTFNGPTETKMHYVFNFYFGVPVQSKDSNLEYWTVERGEWIGDYKEDSDVAKTWTWDEIKSHIPSYTIPEDKIEDYWWYSSKSITWKEDSFVRKLDDDSELSLENYDIYLALKDKPTAADVYVQEGTYSRASYELVVTKNSITYNEQEYRIMKGYIWDKFANNEPNKCCYLPSSDDGKDYTFEIDWQINSGKDRDNFVNIYTPKEYDNSEIPAEWNTETCSKFRGKRVGTLKKQ